MAVRPRGGTWQVDITLNGKRHREPFKTEAEARAWEHAAKSAALSGNPIPRPELPASEQADVSKRGRGAKLSDFLHKAWTIYWKGKASEQNIFIVREIENHFGKDCLLEEVDAEAIDGLIESFITNGNSDSTINKKLAVLSRALHYAVARGHLDKVPTIERKKEGKGRIRFLSDAEEKAIIELLTQWGKDDFRDVFEVLVDTGMRPGELWRMARRDLDMKAKTITIWENKTNTPRTIYMTERVHGIITRRMSGVTSDLDLLFPYDKRWTRLVWDRLRATLKMTHDKAFVLYVARHTCASRMVQRGVPLLVIKEWLGHKAIEMTLRYAILAPTSLKVAVESLNPEQPKSEPKPEEPGADAGMLNALKLLARLGLLPQGVTAEKLMESA